MATGKWKEQLLKSGLPLEQTVGEQIATLGFSLQGEFSFTRLNEHALSREFSVDVHGMDHLHRGKDYWAEFHCLIECKHQNPNKEWIFSPQLVDGYSFGHGLDPIVQTFATRRLAEGPRPSRRLQKLPACGRGVVINNDGDKGPDPIREGLTQLRFAAPNLASELLRNQIIELHDADLRTGILVTILATNAKLKVLRPGVTVAAVEAAKSLDEITDEVPAVEVNQAPGPELTEHCRRLAESIQSEYPDAVRMLGSYRERIVDQKATMLRMQLRRLEYDLRAVSRETIVARVDDVPDLVRTIRQFWRNAHPGLIRIARLQYDAKEGFVRIVKPE